MMHCLILSINGGLLDRSSGSHRIAHHLRTQNWDVEVIDFVDHWTYSELKALFQSRITSNTKFIGLSYLFNRSAINAVLDQLFSWIKEKFPDLVVITGSQAEFTSFTNADYHISGYAEYAIEELLKYKFSNGRSPKFDLTMPGKTKLINAINSYPAYPMRDPMIKYEDRDFIMPNEWGKIEFSRGCKFKCAFCNFPVLGVKGDFTRSAESAREQLLDAYDRFGIKDYVITDETFNDSTEKITKFADVVETLPWKPYFAGFMRGDLLVSRPRDKEELLRMGAIAHYYGIESFNHQSAKIIGKGMNPQRLQEGIVDVKNYFKEHTGKRSRMTISLIAGLPYETLESLELTYHWIKKYWIDQSVIATPLEINDFDTIRRSELSLNYEKFGYKKITNQLIKDHYGFINPETTGRSETKTSDGTEIFMMQHGSTKGIPWINDNMNIFQASEWCDKIDKIHSIRDIPLLKVDCFGLSSIYADTNGLPMTTDKKLRLVSRDRKPYMDNFSKFLESYIHKKLSL